jgi:hypothetical protein
VKTTFAVPWALALFIRASFIVKAALVIKAALLIKALYAVHFL